MSKLTDLLSEVYTKIRDKTPEVITSEHTEVQESALNAMFDLTKIDSHTLQTYTTKNPSNNIHYDLVLRQNGGLVNANMVIHNQGAAAITNAFAFTFKPSDFMPETIAKRIIGTCSENLAYECEFILTDAGLYIDNGSIIPNGSYILNFTYNIKY